jgi:hypothetical protein
MLRQNYLLLILALILLLTNLLGAIFTIRRNHLAKRQQLEHAEGTILQAGFGWAGIYGRLATTQGFLIILAIAATAISLIVKL